MKNHQLADVHLVPTDGESRIVSERAHSGEWSALKYDSLSHKRHPYGGNWMPYDLYFTDNSEIKEGDWFIIVIDSISHVRKCEKVEGTQIRDNQNSSINQAHAKKVITTTNKELWETETIVDGATLGKAHAGRRYKGTISLASIPISFIETYIKSYNDGSPIKQVKLEQIPETVYHNDPPFKRYGQHKTGKTLLKLNPDGSVIILPNEEVTFTLQDMEACFAEGVHAGRAIDSLPTPRVRFKKWINKNFPQLKHYL